MAEVDALHTTIEGLLARAGAGEDGHHFLRRIEDVLMDGYAHSLRLDARRRRLDAEIKELSSAPADEETFKRLRRLALDARTHEARAHELRGRLSLLREQFVSLGGTRVTP